MAGLELPSELHRAAFLPGREPDNCLRTGVYTTLVLFARQAKGKVQTCAMAMFRQLRRKLRSELALRNENYRKARNHRRDLLTSGIFLRPVGFVRGASS